jgi:hypothetical protein
MDGFDHILHWQLKAGSHPFPGQDGGTCINEAALVAAGFAYRPVRSVEDMPLCFSRPICRLAMHLNDEASEAERQRLLPFVTRLACADTAEVERQREAYIALHAPHGLAFQKGLKVLEEVLAIGRQADELGLIEVKTRLEAVQAQATTSTSVADSPLFAKLKSWLAGSKQAEPTS